MELCLESGFLTLRYISPGEVWAKKNFTTLLEIAKNSIMEKISVHSFLSFPKMLIKYIFLNQNFWCLCIYLFLSQFSGGRHEYWRHSEGRYKVQKIKNPGSRIKHWHALKGREAKIQLHSLLFHWKVNCSEGIWKWNLRSLHADLNNWLLLGKWNLKILLPSGKWC